MDLVEAFEADLRVLPLAYESDEGVDRAVERADDVGQRHHHAQGHRPLHHSARGDVGYDYAGGLVEKHRACLLHLSQRLPAQTDVEQFHLYALPLPSLAPLAVVELDLLHGRDHLHQRALFGRCLLEPYVEVAAALHEGGHPQYVAAVARKEYAEYERAVDGEHHREHQEVDHREERRERRAHQKLLYAAVVADALQYVAHIAGVEEVERQPHQLAQEVGYERYVDARRHVEHDPASDEIHRRLRRRQHELRYQYEHDEPQIAPVDAGVDQRLRKKREDQLQHARQHHPRRQQTDLPAIGPEIAQEEAHGAPGGRIGVAAALQVGARGEGEHRSAPFGTFTLGSPVAEHLLLAVDEPLACRIGYVETPSVEAARHTVAHHEVALVPVEYAWHRHLPGEHVDIDFHGFRPEAYRLGCLADAEHRHSAPRDVAEPSQRRERILLAVMACYHPQACRPAVHRVKLPVVGEGAK